MEAQIFSFVFGAISALFIAIITHLLSIKRFRQATVYGEQIKSYSELMPILVSPLENEIGTSELKSIFNKAILVSTGTLSEELSIFLNCIIDVRLGKGIYIGRKRESLSIFRKFIKKWQNVIRIKSDLVKDLKRDTFFQKMYAKFYYWKLNQRLRLKRSKLDYTGPFSGSFTATFEGRLSNLEEISVELEKRGIKIINMIHKKMNLL